jgi:hypothetical protein
LTSNSANGLTASGGGGGGSGDGLAGGSGGGSSYELSAVGTANQSSQTQKSLTGTTLVVGSNADGTTLTNYGYNGVKESPKFIQIIANKIGAVEVEEVLVP